MHVFHSFGNLVQVSFCCGLFQSNFRLNGIEEVSTLSELLHHYKRGLCLVGTVVGSDDVGVASKVSSILQLLLEIRSSRVGFAYCFDCNQLSSGFIFSNPCCAISALASLLYEGVSLIQVGALGVSCHCK